MSTTRLIGKRTYESMLTESPTHTHTRQPIHHPTTSSCSIEANAMTPSSTSTYIQHQHDTSSLLTSSNNKRFRHGGAGGDNGTSSAHQSQTSALSLLSAPTNDNNNMNTYNHTSNKSPIRSYEQSQFVAHDIDAVVNHDIQSIHQQHQPHSSNQKRKSQYHCQCSHGNSNNSNTTDDQPLYTYDQVKRILHDALRRQQDQLRVEYDDTLHRLLREQFDSFSAFNRDYISRQLKTSDLSYLS